ncbi:MAG: glycosyltransferase family 4 protein [Candidatus Aminicenantia bacterium]
MKIGIDVRPFLRRETGVGIYLKNLILNLAKIDKENLYFLFSSSLKDRFDRNKIPDSLNFRLFDNLFPVSLINFLWNRAGFPKIDFFFFKKMDIVHSPHPLLIPTFGKCIITVHDLFFYKNPGSTVREMKKDYPERILKSIEKADGIICPSLYTKSEILRLFNCEERKIKVIYHGVNEIYAKEPEQSFVEKVRSKYSLPSKFILFVGNIEPRKNLEILIEAFLTLKDKFTELMLVIVGEKILGYEELENIIEKNNLKERVFFIGYVDSEELSVIYRLSSIFVFPSIEEGFGLPVIEAMASSVPVVASSVSSIPEIARDSILYFNPYSFSELAEKIESLLQNFELRMELVRRGLERAGKFSWKKAAEETLDFYREVHNT